MTNISEYDYDTQEDIAREIVKSGDYDGYNASKLNSEYTKIFRDIVSDWKKRKVFKTLDVYSVEFKFGNEFESAFTATFNVVQVTSNNDYYDATINFDNENYTNVEDAIHVIGYEIGSLDNDDYDMEEYLDVEDLPNLMQEFIKDIERFEDLVNDAGSYEYIFFPNDIDSVITWLEYNGEEFGIDCSEYTNVLPNNYEDEY